MRLAPWIAAAFALLGLVCLPVSAYLGINAASDLWLDGARLYFILAIVIFLAYVAIGLIREFIQTT
jgi:flagellar biogenesis protein FliO